jgi:hypothetical protein
MNMMNLTTGYTIEISELNISPGVAIRKGICIAKAINDDVKVTIKTVDMVNDIHYEDIDIWARKDSNWMDLEMIYHLKLEAIKKEKKN